MAPRRLAVIASVFAALLAFTGTVGSTPPPASGVDKSPPANTALPTISGKAQTGETLTGNPGTWSGFKLSFSYAWQRCDSVGASCSDIPAATASTYKVVSADEGHALRFKVTASNRLGSATAVSDPTAAVVAAAGGGGATSDTTPPSVAFTSPADNPPGGYTYLSGTITLSAGAADNVGVASVSFYFGSELIATDTTAPYAATYDTSKWSSGQTSFVKAVAKDGAGNQASDQIYVEITTSTTTTTVSPATLPGGTVGTGYSQQLSASGPTPPYSFKLTQGALPSGLTLSSAGLVSGTPTASGSFGFTVSAIDAGGATAASQAYTIAVASAPAPAPSSSSSKLAWAPPGYDGSGDPRDPANYPGYIVVDAPQTNGTLVLDNTKDYFIRLGHPTWSSLASGISSLSISGGRNRVIIGGQITNYSTNTTDDMRALVIDGGDPSGITHIEGVLFDQSVNAITLRTPQTVQIENVRVADNHVYRDDASAGVHPDLIQTWGTAGQIRTDHFTGYTDYTGLSILMTPNPTRWTRYNVDLHALPPQSNSVSSSLPLVGGNFVYFGDQKVTQYVGSNLWMETGYYDSSYQRKLDDVIGYGQTCSPFELHPGPGLSGSTYTSPNPCSGGSGGSSSPSNLGKRQGDSITFSRIPLLSGESWSWGDPPGGDFVPAGVAGTNYVSPGYQ